MKTCNFNFPSFLIECVAILAMLACSSNSDDVVDKAGHPTLLNFTHSGCKVESSAKTSIVGNSLSLLSSSRQNSPVEKDVILLTALPDGKLRIAHDNATLSCEALIQTDFRFDGKTLVLTEKSTDDTNCTCDYDLVFTLEGLEEAEYHVIIERQTIDRQGKATQKAIAYGEVNFTYSKNLSLTTKINYYEKH